MLKFFKASSFYDEFISEIYTENPGLDQKSYDEQYAELMSACISWSDYWKTNLEATGEFITTEIIANAKGLQIKWAEEHQVTYGEDTWLLDILEAQLREIQPDVFFAHDYFNIPSEFIQRMRREMPSIKYVLSYDGIGLQAHEKFEGCDLILSCAQFICDYYDNYGFDTLYFPFGFEASILDKIKKREPIYDTTFSGSIIVRENFHNQRLHFLAEISKKINLSLWANALPENWNLYHKEQLKRIKNGKYQEYLDVYRLGKINQGKLYGINMFQILSDSKIVINNHIDFSGDIAGNKRLTEATGIGSCLLTDYKSNIHTIFKPDEEIIVYKSADEAVEKIKYLLSHDEERKTIAQAGQNRTLSEYSFARTIEPVIQKILTKLGT